MAASARLATPGALAGGHLPAGLVVAGSVVMAVATLLGAWLALRSTRRHEAWLGAAAGALLVIALLHLLPAAWSAAGTPGLWPLAVPAAGGGRAVGARRGPGPGGADQPGRCLTRTGRAAPGPRYRSLVPGRRRPHRPGGPRRRLTRELGSTSYRLLGEGDRLRGDQWPADLALHLDVGVEGISSFTSSPWIQRWPRSGFSRRQGRSVERVIMSTSLSACPGISRQA